MSKSILLFVYHLFHLIFTPFLLLQLLLLLIENF